MGALLENCPQLAILGLSPSTILTLSPTLSEGESEQKETSCGSGLATLAPTTTDVTVHTVFVEMHDSWII